MAQEKARFKMYFGEEAEAATSEDEDYLGVRSDGYTRDEMVARQSKLAAVKAFEEEVSASRSARGIEVVRAPSHRALSSSVRPREGTEVTVSYWASKGGERVASEERIALLAAGDGDEEGPAGDWRWHVARLVRDMRRGEKIRVEVGEASLEVELVTVRSSRRLSPRESSPWRALIVGSVSKQRLVCGSSPTRATWGDKVVVRLVGSPPRGASVEALQLALDEEQAREIVVGDGVAPECLETAVAAMKHEEMALISASGELVLTEAQAAERSPGTRDDWLAAVRVEAIGKVKPDDDDAAEAAGALKRRGTVLAAAGRWRRAEALYTRAIRRLDAAFASKPDDDERSRVEDSLVVPLLMNLAVCARKRRGHGDEEALLTKALRLRRSPDAAFKAKAYVRRAAARVDLDKFSDARDDLRLAAENAKKLDDDGLLVRDVQRQLARLNERKKAERDAAKTKYAGARAAFCDVVQVDQDNETVPPRKPAPLLYQKEIDDRLKAQRPWDHDPEYHKIGHAPRQPLDASPPVLREDNLKDQYKAFDDEDEELKKISSSLHQNWVMKNMYDTNGTGRRGRKPKGGGELGGEGDMTFMRM